MLNLREFTELVDKLGELMTKEELQTAFHSLARKVPEEKRENFLEILNHVREIKDVKAEAGDVVLMAKAQDKEEIEKEYARLQKAFEEIEEGEVGFDAQGYEDYSSGYWDSDFVYEYEDPQDIGSTYEDAAEFIGRCVNDGFYQEAQEMFDRMMETEAFVSDGEDGFCLGLSEIMEEGLVSVDKKLLKQNVLYAVYQNTPSQDRPEELYDYFTSGFFFDVRLEDVMSLGKEELPGLSEFWKNWIGFLSEKRGDEAGRLLREAVTGQGSKDEMTEAARKAAGLHPSLFLGVLEYFEENGEFERLLVAGKEALEIIDKKYILRSQIALKTARAALERGDVDFAELCWKKAFESSSSPVNYLRIAGESRDGKSFCREAARLVEELNLEDPGEYGRDSVKELAVNRLSKNEKLQMEFLTGNFEEPMAACRQVKEGLGWSAKFVKCGIPLFLLLLLRADTLGKGGCYAAKEAAFHLGFRAEEYDKGTTRQILPGKPSEKSEDRGGDVQVFWECFCRWKENHGASETEEGMAGRHLAYLEKLVDMRVKAIISGQHRAHYGSVAALAAALGEVKESRGDYGAKNRLLLGYREMFPRHSSFHEELRRYGMPDTRKNARRR